jgi:hypothetical protein
MMAVMAVGVIITPAIITIITTRTTPIIMAIEV